MWISLWTLRNFVFKPDIWVRMLSALALTPGKGSPDFATPEAIVRTLAGLVPLVVEGIIRDVVLATWGDAADALEIAEHAGCSVAQGVNEASALAAAIAAAKSDRLFVLRAGHAPEAGFDQEARDLFDGLSAAAPRSAILRAAPESFLTRVFPAAAGAAAFIANRQDIPGGGKSFEGLRKALQSPLIMRCRMRRLV